MTHEMELFKIHVTSKIEKNSGDFPVKRSLKAIYCTGTSLKSKPKKLGSSRTELVQLTWQMVTEGKRGRPDQEPRGVLAKHFNKRYSNNKALGVL